MFRLWGNLMAAMVAPQIRKVGRNVASVSSVNGFSDMNVASGLVTQRREMGLVVSVSPVPVNGFSEMNVPLHLVTRLSEMEIADPTPIQKGAIPHAMEGRDVMGLAQTGTGKTLAFGVPLVTHMDMAKRPAPKTVRGLVLAPTRELASQIAVSLRTLTKHTPIQTTLVVGGVNIQTQINKLRPGTDLLVATPGRLIDLMDRRSIVLAETSFLVLDEADLMLDLGFLPSLRKIEKMLPKKRQTMLFSATMSKNMNEIARSYLTNPIRVEVARAGRTADKVTQELHFIAQADKLEKLLELLGKHHRDDRVLVFGRTKHGMEKLSKKLLNAGFKAGSIHGNKSQPQRDKAIAAFKSGVIRILVATDVAARGLDIPDVKHVYNYELPDVPEAYIHRIGRTARAGKEGAAIAFCSVEEMDDLHGIQKVTGVKIPVVSGSPWGRNESRVAKERIKENKLNEQKKRRESSKTVGRDNKKQINSYIKVKSSHDDRPGSKTDDGERRRSDGEIRDDFRPRRKVVGGGSKRRSDQEANAKSGRPQRTNPPENARKRFTNTPEWSISE